MRYRPLDTNGDYTVNVPFLYNVPAVVGQAVLTRLKLWQGEWFANTADGTPYLQSVLGATAQAQPDLGIKQRILQTPGVLAMLSYVSTINSQTRQLQVSAQLNTVYGVIPVLAVL